MTNRADSAFTFQTDKFAGFSLNGMYALNNANSTVLNAGTGAVAAGASATSVTTPGGGNANWGGWGLGADYTWNKFYIVGAVQQFRTKLDSSVMSASNLLNLQGATPLGGQALPATNAQVVLSPNNTTDQQFYVGSTYDFGILKAYAQYINRTINQNTAGGGNVDAGSPTAGTQLVGQQLKRTAEQIGVRSYITPTIEAWAQAGLGKYTGAITAGTAASPSLPVANFVMYQVGTNYYLCKRTNLYAAFGAYNASSQTQNNGLAGAGSNYALGVRHTF